VSKTSRSDRAFSSAGILVKPCRCGWLSAQPRSSTAVIFRNGPPFPLKKFESSAPECYKSLRRQGTKKEKGMPKGKSEKQPSFGAPICNRLCAWPIPSLACRSFRCPTFPDLKFQIPVVVKKYKITKRTHLCFSLQPCSSGTYKQTARFRRRKRTHLSHLTHFRPSISRAQVNAGQSHLRPVAPDCSRLHPIAVGGRTARGIRVRGIYSFAQHSSASRSGSGPRRRRIRFGILHSSSCIQFRSAFRVPISELGMSPTVPSATPMNISICPS